MNGHGLRILRASVWRRRQPRLDLRAPLRPLSSLRRRSNITPVLPEPSSNLTAYYESEQLAALKDAEQGSLPSESVNWKPRKQDASSIPYFTDLSRVDPFLDLSPQGIPKSGRWPMQPIPRMPTAQFRQGEEEDGSKVKELAQLTGLSVAYLETLKVRELVSHRVTNQTRLGKIAKKYVLSVAGDGNGMVGIGEASSTVSELASRLSQYQAIKNMRPIPRYENRTIYGDVVHKFGAAEVSLMSRPPGKLQKWTWVS